MAAPILTITHYLFLTREQRYALSVPETEIEVIGCCTPVWIQNGVHLSKIAEEIFAKYRIRHCPEPEKQTINSMDEGFLIRLSPDMPKFLLDCCDNGQQRLCLTHKNIITIDDKVAPVVHFLTMEDIQVLEETLC
jgi:hypothetical protein